MSGAPSGWDRGDAATSHPGGSRSILLEPRAAAAGQARRWIATALAEWPPVAVETAQLLLSEVVTNAVLHARTAIDVRVQPAGDGIRVEVADGTADGPLPKHYDADAATGRGLYLVAGLAQDWGVIRVDDGKVVWFTLAPSTGEETPAGATGGGGPHVAPADLLVSLEAWTQLGEETAAEAPVTDADSPVDVRIEGLPVEVYLETAQHNDAILREFTLILQSARTGVGGHLPDVPRRLVDLADEVRAVFGTATSDVRTQVDQALQGGASTVDLRLTVPATGWERLLLLAEQLDEADRYCEEGDLLTLASSPAVRRFRRWYAEEVASQLHGQAPTPWPFGTTGDDR